jgi:hypothetical protein
MLNKNYKFASQKDLQSVRWNWIESTFHPRSTYIELHIEDSHYYTSCFVRELLLLRDNALVLSNNIVFSFDDLELLIKVACTCWFELYIALMYAFVYDLHNKINNMGMFSQFWWWLRKTNNNPSLECSARRTDKRSFFFDKFTPINYIQCKRKFKIASLELHGSNKKCYDVATKFCLNQASCTVLFTSHCYEQP